jgi:ABC-type glycerol-3-phosphate transport system permease component
MPIISKVAQRSLKARLLILGMYLLLLGGALSMLYPFGLMLAGSTKSGMDNKEVAVIPDFITSNQSLWAKYAEGLFNESLEKLKGTYSVDITMFDQLKPKPDSNTRFIEQWKEFINSAEISDSTYAVGFLYTPNSKSTPLLLRKFRKQMMDRFDGSIDKLNTEFGTHFPTWNSLTVLPENYLIRSERPSKSPLNDEVKKFKIRQPLTYRYYFSVEGLFRERYLKSQIGRDIAQYNQAQNTNYKSYNEVPLARRLEDSGYSPKQREDWEVFVRSILNLLWIKVDQSAASRYQGFLKAKYGTIDKLNKSYNTHSSSFSAISIPSEIPPQGPVLSDWDFFIRGWKDSAGNTHMAPLESLRIDSTDFWFRDYLRKKYSTLEKLNKELGTKFISWQVICPPQQEFHYQAFSENISSWRWEFIKRNYLAVFDFLAWHGRGMINTFIYCTFAVLGSLIVNPLAAYALSRYKPRSTYKILLILLVPMAFPPMVTQIPVFLLLKELRLLNTFFALVLPTLVNGYAIFLLKGFFDSLPQELYESASLDGAGEFRIFWQITMSLSKPILAVIALNAFTLAYSNFMFALLICQDPRMWTLMVWLYELQEIAGQGVFYASLVVAAIPPFLVFALCQNVIMRGIVVPVEK